MLRTAKIALCLAFVVLAAAPASAATGHRVARGQAPAYGPGPGIISDSCATVVVGPCRTHPESW
jgi:hypothetical protein